MRSNIFFIIIVALLLSGCVAGREYLPVRSAPAVESSFQSAQFEPGYTYYYFGPDSEPRALLALDERYTLESVFWHEFSEEAQFNSWIDDLNRLRGRFNDFDGVVVDYKGLNIYDPANNKIGMIYSRFHWVVAWRGEGNELVIAPPEPNGNQRIGIGRFTRVDH